MTPNAAANPTTEQKERARQFRDSLMLVLDPLLAEDELKNGLAPGKSVEALVLIYRNGAQGELPWNAQHPMWVEHEGLRNWQAASLAGARHLGWVFSDQSRWQSSGGRYQFIGNDLRLLDELTFRITALRQQLDWTI